MNQDPKVNHLAKPIIYAWKILEDQKYPFEIDVPCQKCGQLVTVRKSEASYKIHCIACRDKEK